MSLSTQATQKMDIRNLLPHAGEMCLLDGIESYDMLQIVCRASSHRHPHNPLRHANQLSIQTGIEYAAQTVAIHGYLRDMAIGKIREQPRGGYIAVLTNITWSVDRLDDLATDLFITAVKQVDMADGLCYHFDIKADECHLIGGELIVALQPEAIPSGA